MLWRLSAARKAGGGEVVAATAAYAFPFRTGVTRRVRIAIRRTADTWSAICRTDIPSGKMIRRLTSAAGAAAAATSEQRTTTSATRRTSAVCPRLDDVAEVEMCWRCPTPMAFVHGTWQCPRCKFKLGCCEGDPQTNCEAQPAVATPSTART